MHKSIGQLLLGSLLSLVLLTTLALTPTAHGAPKPGCYQGKVNVTKAKGQPATQPMDARLLIYGRKDVADTVFVMPLGDDGDIFVNDLMCGTQRCALAEDSGDFGFTIKGAELTVLPDGEWLAAPGDPSIRRTSPSKPASPAQTFKQMSKADCESFKKEIGNAHRPPKLKKSKYVLTKPLS